MISEKQKSISKNKEILEKYNKFILDIFFKNQISVETNFNQLSELISKDRSINLCNLFENVDLIDNISKENYYLSKDEENLQFNNKLKDYELKISQSFKDSKNLTLINCGILNCDLII